MTNDDSLSDRNFLVTGAVGAIGFAAAELLCRRGGNVLLVDVDAPGLVGLEARLPSDRIASCTADVTVASEVGVAFDRAEERFGPLDGVVLAAGIEGPISLTEDCDDEAFEAVMAINVKGVWLSLKQSLARMKPRSLGSIVILSSISGTGGAPYLSAYSASKHAVLGLMRSAAREAAASGVRVNAVCPGPVRSDMIKRIERSLEKARSGRTRDSRDPALSLPMGRYARADEVAHMIAFLCSNASGYCTGGTFMVDGGYSAR